MRKGIYLFSAILLLSTAVYAQLGTEGAFDAKNYGMGRTYNAVSKGLFSVGINPANLIAYPAQKMEISALLPIPSLSVKGGTDFISINDINYFFGGVNGESRYLNADDKTKLMDLFADGGVIGMNMSVNLFMISMMVDPIIGSFAFTINDIAAAKIDIPTAVAEVALYGNPAGKVFDFSKFDVKSWYLRTYALSYAKRVFTSSEYPFNVISAGITLKYIQGFSYAGTDKMNSSFSTNATGQIDGNADFRGYSAFSSNFGVKYDFDAVKPESSFSLFPSPAGSGFGFDLGAAASFGDTWRLSLAITDIGTIKWNKNAAQFTANGTIYLDDLTNESQRDSLEEKFVGKSKKIDSFNTSLPTVLRFGVSYNATSQLVVAMDYNIGFNDMPGNSTTGRLSVGLDWKPMDWIPYLRTGFTFGGLYGFGWAAGMGFNIDIIEINIATTDFNSFMAPNKAKYLSFAFDTRWKF